MDLVISSINLENGSN